MKSIENVSCEDEKALEDLRMRVKNILTPCLLEDDTVFYRFLKARDFDVDKAEKMLRKHITWRKIYQADTILDNFQPAEFFEKLVEPSIIGFDKEENLVAYVPVGKLNVFEIFKCTKMNDFMKHWTWFGEKRIAFGKIYRKNGSKAYQATLIMDLDKLTLGNATSKLALDLFFRLQSLYQDNHPDRMKSLYIINAPSYYAIPFSILKTVMPYSMVRKIHVFGYSGWKEELLKHIDADVLPSFLGGNRRDPDGNPFCKTFVTHGGRFPEKYFLSDEERYFMDITKVKTATIPSSDKIEIYVPVTEEGCLIQWEFLVRGKDIGFGLFFQDSVQEVKQVIPVYKCSTPDGTERNSYECHSTGKYIIIFDNSYSWLSSKEIEYCITVLKNKPVKNMHAQSLNIPHPELNDGKNI